MADAAVAPDEVARKEFSTSFRGYDQNGVRAYLSRVAMAMAAAEERERSLRERLAGAEARAVPLQVGEAELETALGQEATRVIRAAREAATEIVAKAREHSTAMLAEAEEQAHRQRSEAEDILSTRSAEADREAADIRARAAEEGAASVAEAQARGRDMVVEAQAVRERVLKDLAKRRRLARQQIDQLRAGRERLLEAYRVVQDNVDLATRELAVAEVEARSAAEAASLRAELEPETSVEELELEVVAARDAGLVPYDYRDSDAEIEEGGEESASDLEREQEGPSRPSEREPVINGSDGESNGNGKAELRRHGDVNDGRPARFRVRRRRNEVSRHDLGVLIPPDEIEGVRIIPAYAEPVDQSSAPPSEEPDADQIFARIRAERAAVVVEAESTPAESLSLALDPAGDPVETEGVTEVDPSNELLERRSAATESTHRSLAKVLKRALADEQNEVLDGLRRRSGAESLDQLLLDRPSHLHRFAEAAEAPLRAAAEAGAGTEASVAEEAIAAINDQLAGEIVDALRQQFEELRQQSSDDDNVLTEGVSVAYRELKASRLDDLVSHHILAAYSLGSFAAVPEGLLRWIVDPDEGRCPDCDDNALAGPLSKGDTFPTGQTHPPAHTGCRCLVVPIQH